jgi:hypothetical protein
MKKFKDDASLHPFLREKRSLLLWIQKWTRSTGGIRTKFHLVFRGFHDYIVKNANQFCDLIAQEDYAAGASLPMTMDN